VDRKSGGPQIPSGALANIGARSRSKGGYFKILERTKMNTLRKRAGKARLGRKRNHIRQKCNIQSREEWAKE